MLYLIIYIIALGIINKALFYLIFNFYVLKSYLLIYFIINLKFLLFYYYKLILKINLLIKLLIF